MNPQEGQRVEFAFGLQSDYDKLFANSTDDSEEDLASEEQQS